jgi:hypothetical protein
MTGFGTGHPFEVDGMVASNLGFDFHAWTLLVPESLDGRGRIVVRSCATGMREAPTRTSRGGRDSRAGRFIEITDRGRVVN